MFLSLVIIITYPEIAMYTDHLIKKRTKKANKESKITVTISMNSFFEISRGIYV